ncbi:MAG: class flavin-dependent oxidoreductase [Acidimicrobiales bacterium]|nr:class flavin-dependent oxidoreductase [Acidimicrobiales bacterium]
MPSSPTPVAGPGSAVPAPLATGSVSLRLYPHDLDAANQIATIRRQAVLAIESGYDGVMVSEHHADFPGYFPHPIQLSQTLLSAMPSGWAAASPLLLPMQPYALLAEQVAWLAATYPGRVGAGFAAGALPIDFELAEVPFGEIIDRFKTSLPRIVAALRGRDETPLGKDRALQRCVEHPVPMVVAAQSAPAVRRAAGLGIGVLYDSLQSNAVSRRLSDIFEEAGGAGPKVLIRRVWIGEPPREAMAAQMDRYRAAASEKAIEAWGQADQLISGADAAEAADRLIATLRESNCDTVNVRVHLRGLSAETIDEQIAMHRAEFVPRVRAALAALT